MLTKKKSGVSTVEQIIDINSTKETDKSSGFINKRIFLSVFDHKGAKAFLWEKEEALKRIVLNDEILIQNKEENNVIKNKYNKKNHHSKSPSKNKKKSKKNVNEEILKFPTFGENEDNIVFIY